MSDCDAVTKDSTWIARALPLIALGLVGCGGGFAGSTTPQPSKLSVNPSSITVADGSVTPFTAVFTPTVSAPGSLTWSVSPVNAGTITDAGVYTASATAGPYTVIATWTPTISHGNCRDY
jgi:hypothetical protein